MPFRLQWPTVSRKINQHFLNNPDFYAQFGIPGHEGIDLFAPTGADIYACADGEVYEVYPTTDHNYGIHVRIRHEHPDGIFKSIYAHLQEAKVRVGDRVRAGDLIGLADSTGNSTGSHLHLTLKKEGATALGESTFIAKDGRQIKLPNDIIDPTPFLDPQPAEIPSRPAKANHPSSELLGGAPYVPSGGRITVPEREMAIGGGGEGLTLEFTSGGKTESYKISNFALKITLPTAPPKPGEAGLTSDASGQAHTLKVNDVLSVVIQGSLPWVEPPKPPAGNVTMRVSSSVGLNVRSTPAIANNVLVKLATNTIITVTSEVRDDGVNVWRKVVSPVSYEGITIKDGWVAEKQSDGDPVYLTQV